MTNALRLAACGALVAVLACAPMWATLGQLRNLVELLTLLTLA